MDKVMRLLEKEKVRQETTLMMIPSENYTYPEVRAAVGSWAMHKYSEGQAGARYYQGNEYIDEVERLAKSRALSLFGLSESEWGVNVQALSGTPANLAVMNALLAPGDGVLSMYLYDGGHLSHGWSYKDKKITLSSKIWDIHYYGVDTAAGVIDYEKLEKTAKDVRPKLIISGGTAYAPEVDHEKFASIAKKAGAYYLADVSHEAGLIAAGVNKSPFKSADAVMMTTHKTLRGPRGALIFSKKDISGFIDASVFPGIQGGPHNEIIAGIAIALKKANTTEFKEYAERTVKNARALAEALQSMGFKVVSGGTEKHLVLLDLTGRVNGWFAAWALEFAGIIVNRNSVPGEKSSPYYPSGIRLGTPALSARGMGEREMKAIARLVSDVIAYIGNRAIPEDPEIRKAELIAFKKDLKKDKFLGSVAQKVRDLCKEFPIK